MASDPLGNLDEFFDFAQLESDTGNGCYAEDQQYELPAQAFSGLELNPIMDWEPTAYEASNCLPALPSQAITQDFEYLSHGPIWTDLPTAPQDSQYLSVMTDQSTTINIDSVFRLDANSCGVNPVECIAQRPPTPIVNSTGSKEIEPFSSPSKQQAPARQRATNTNDRTPASAKRKGPSTRIPLEARQMLEEEFATNQYPCSWEIDIIAHQANLDAKRVRIWFNNARARKKNPDDIGTMQGKPGDSSHSLVSKLSAESLEALSKQVDEGVPAPQPPLAFYLASSYLEEAAEVSDIQAAVEIAPTSDRGVDTFMDSSSGSRIGKSGSVVTSLTSSDGSAPTTYTMSSGGSEVSSFGRDRRRGRRRMTWRASPYGRTKINGLNDAGVPAKDLPFFCTFCPRAFKTKYEWVRHEDSVHALRTTWICCTSRQDPLGACIFCGQLNPDEVHMAGHKYQQCRNKPETHRTFYRRDHFVQHLHHVHFSNVKHPSVRLGCQGRIAAEENINYGCKHLANRWRRFGAPMRSDDPMLHCGFCGKELQDWTARCDHVAEHLAGGGLDRLAWWAHRKEHHMENLCVPQTAGPFRCRYCQKVFANADAMNKHSHCRVWSCRFLQTFDDVASENHGPPLCPQFPSPKAHHCHLCGAGYKNLHVEHAQQYHKYRQCKQDLYTSQSDFLTHLHEFHGASHPLLLQHNPVLEQHFSRNKGASFEPVDFDEILQGCRIATPTDSFVDPFTVKESRPSSESTEGVKPSTPPRRKTHERHSDRPDVPTKVQRQRSDRDASPKPEPPGPRFFRLDPLVPFLASRIYYLRNAKMSSLFDDGKALLNEVPKGHIASLVMSSGLLGMAGVRMPTQMKKYDSGGLVELAIEDDD